MVNTAPLAVLISDFLYLTAAVAGGLAGYVPGHYLRRAIVRVHSDRTFAW